MHGIVLRLLIYALGLWLAGALVPGINIQFPGTLLIAAVLMGIVNAVIRPIVVLLTIPITVISLGLFLLVINAAMFGLVAALLDGFQVSGFFAAFFGWLIVSITSTIASWYIGPQGRYKILIVERR